MVALKRKKFFKSQKHSIPNIRRKLIENQIDDGEELTCSKIVIKSFDKSRVRRLLNFIGLFERQKELKRTKTLKLP